MSQCIGIPKSSLGRAEKEAEEYATKINRKR
jgi:hypothetical protein